MPSKKKNLSESGEYNYIVPNGTCVGIVVSEWNPEVTDALSGAARKTLLRHGLKASDIIIRKVPGSFELPLGAQYLIENTAVDAVICLGCVIQGETRHFEFICQAVSQQIARLNLDYNMPVIFGVLTTDNMNQALDRAGGKHGNKGDEAAVAAIKMIGFRNEISQVQP